MEKRSLMENSMIRPFEELEGNPYAKGQELLPATTEQNYPVVTPENSKSISSNTSLCIAKFDSSACMVYFNSSMKQIIALAILILWTIIDFLCCSLTNKWLRNVVVVSLQVFSDLIFYTIMSMVTIMITIAVNVEQYRKQSNESLEESKNNQEKPEPLKIGTFT